MQLSEILQCYFMESFILGMSLMYHLIICIVIMYKTRLNDNNPNYNKELFVTKPNTLPCKYPQFWVGSLLDAQELV